MATPPAGAKRLGSEALLAVAQTAAPDWTQLSLRLGGGPRENRMATRDTAQAVSITVRQPRQWPRTATTTLLLDPYTGEVLKRETYADLSAARRVRSWTRFLHTGQALGVGGQLIAGLACVGGCFLVYTGLALACRRFLNGRKKSAA